MPNTDGTGFPVALDTANTFRGMTDAPLAESTLTADIDTTQPTLPVADRAKFFNGHGIVTIEGTNEMCKYTGGGGSAGAGNLTGVARNWGSNIGGVAGTGVAAVSGSKVRHLMTWEHFRIMVAAIIAVETRVGKTGDPNTSSHDYRLAQLEAATLGAFTQLALVNSPETSVSNNNVVRFDGTVYRQCSPASGHIPLGIMQGISGGFGTVIVAGLVTGLSGLTAGVTYYAGATGSISASPGTWQLGVALSTTDLLLDIREVSDFPLIWKAQTIDGATVVDRSIVAWNRTTSRFELADANGTHTSVPMALAFNCNAGANTGDMLILGSQSGFSGLTAGALYYLSPTTPGGITTTPSGETTDKLWLVGQAIATNILHLRIQALGNAQQTPCDDDSFATVVGTSVQAALDSIDDILTTLDYADISANDGSTDVTGPELEQLTDGSDVNNALIALDLHNHNSLYGDGGVWDKRQMQYLTDVPGSAFVKEGFPDALGSVNGSFASDNDGPWYTHSSTLISANNTLNTPDPVARAGWLPEVVFKLKTEAIIADGRWWFGLFSALPTGLAPAISYGALFYDSATHANWRAKADSGTGSPYNLDTGIVVAANTEYLLRIVWVSSTTIHMFINNVFAGGMTGGTVPAIGTDLRLAALVHYSGGSGLASSQWKLSRIALRHK